MSEKEKKPLNPIIEEKNPIMPIVDLEKLNKEIDINTILDVDKEDEDSFFKSVVTQMFNNKDVETKSYNTGVKESFELARLSFLGERCNIPSMTEFVDRLERKRISIDRKGRIELVTALIERQQEIERKRALEARELARQGI